MFERIGYVTQLFGVSCFVKNVTQQHFFIKYSGFGISKQILDELKKFGIPLILYIYHSKDGSKKLYLTKRKRYEESSKTYLFGGKDFQYFVSLNEMEELNGTNLFV